MKSVIIFVYLLLSLDDIALSQCICSLDDACANGNVTNYSMRINTLVVGATGGPTGDYRYDRFFFGNPTNSYYYEILGGVPSANRIFTLPDWGGQIATQISPITTYVGDTTHQYSYASNAGVGVVSDGVTAAAITRVGDYGLLVLNNGAVDSPSVLMSQALHPRINYLPDGDGPLLLNHGFTNVVASFTGATSWVVPRPSSLVPGTVNIIWRTAHPINIWLSFITSTNFTITWTVPFTGTMAIDWQWVDN